MTTSTIKLESCDKFFGDVMDRIYDVITFILRRPGIAIFSDIIKIVTMFIKTNFKNSRKVKRIRDYLSNCNPYLYFLI